MATTNSLIPRPHDLAFKVSTLQGGGPSAIGFDDVRLTVVVDDLSSPEHDRALVDIGGADILGISVAPPTGEPDLPPHLLDQRVPYDTVRGLQRRADATTTDPSMPDTRATSSADDDSATARAAQPSGARPCTVASSST